MTGQKQTSSNLVAEATKFLEQGNFALAADAARRALTADLNNANALNILGVAEGRLGRIDIAIQHLRRLVVLRPTSPDAHFNLGFILHQGKDLAGAERHYREAIRLKPKSAVYYNNLGSIFQERKEIAPARECYEKAVQCDPRHEGAVTNLYGVYRTLGDIDALEKLTAQTTKQWPQVSIHWVTRAEALFLLGRLAEAWDCYEWRFKASDRQYAATARSVPGIPNWQGENLAGKSVLVWTEQGPGDEMLYATYLPEVCALVGRLVVFCSKRMAPLFQRTFPNIEVYGDTVPDDVLKAMDAQAPLVAFAKPLRPNLAAFTGKTSKLISSSEKSNALRASYSAGAEKLLVGISWRSNRVQYADDKTVGLGSWGALFALPGVTFVNLQYGDCDKEIDAIKTAYGVSVLNDKSIDSMADLDAYAAQVAAMDVVVSSSNTAAHMAGALHVPTHCMIPVTVGHGRRWYWLEHDGVCAWYPSLKIHTQRQFGVWTDIIRDVTLEVAALVFARGFQKDIALYLTKLAHAYRTAGDQDSAIAVLTALSRFPGYEHDANFELGRYAKEAGRLEDAEAYFRLALQFKPNSGPALNMVGFVLAERKDAAGAEEFYRRAITAAPEAHEAYNNLGTTVRSAGRGTEATTLYARANALCPKQVGILLNLATNLTEIGRAEEAIPYFDELLQIKPDYPEAHHSRAFALLSVGRFKEGWSELAWRLKAKQSSLRPPEALPPRWGGEAIAQKSLLIWTEDGLGDELLAASLLPEAINVASAITIACSRRLVKILQRAFPATKVVEYSAFTSLDLARFDYQLSISDLGAAFRPSIEAFNQQHPFLIPKITQRDQLRDKYQKGTQAPLVGLSWASANGELAALKSISLKKLMTGLSGVRTSNEPAPLFVSVQYGTHTPEISETVRETGIPVIEDLDIDPILDLDGFVAQVAAMDAVVTISNTTAHFAGALGIPTFLLLPYGRGRHWYWLRAYQHCPWYPSVRYFVQTADGSWDSALSKCREAVDEMIKRRRT